ncbi:putative chaperonin GroEL [Bacillus phage vB_BspM_Internexus]|nr:putative chaperonin GroEL [Bacillus phage vB_BspM_Internexus]
MSVNSNVANQIKTKEVITETLNVLTTILSNSLGPYGSTSIIQDKLTVNHAITKDGYSILNKIKFDNEIASTILDIVKKISRSLVREVGDGSTSAIVVSNSLFKELDSLISEFKVPRKDIIDTLAKFEEVLVEFIKKEATEITEENFDIIKEIATVSNNNDEKAGQIIYDIYKEIGADGFINLELSDDVVDSYTVTKGIELNRGYITNDFANQVDKVTTEFKDALVFMSNQTLDADDSDLIGDLMGSVMFDRHKPLVIISKGYSSEIANMLRINHRRDGLEDMVAIDYALANDHHRESFEDLAIYLGATIYDKFEMGQLDKFDIDKLGKCNKVTVNENTTKLIEGQGDPQAIKERIEYLNTRLEEISKREKYIDTTEDEYKIKKRIADLNCSIANLFIGGSTELEKETRKFLMEDAVFACRSALRNGYISGGNLIIPRIIDKNLDNIIEKIISDKSLFRYFNDGEKYNFIKEFSIKIKQAFRNSFETVLMNKFEDNENLIDDIISECIVNDKIYNLKTDEFEDINNTKIINSTQTDIEIMKATFSIIGLLVTSNQFVSVQYQQ